MTISNGSHASTDCPAYHEVAHIQADEFFHLESRAPKKHNRSVASASSDCTEKRWSPRQKDFKNMYVYKGLNSP